MTKLENRFEAERLLKDAKQAFTDKEDGFERVVLKNIKHALDLGHPEAKFAAAYLAVTGFPGAEGYLATAKDLMVSAAKEGYPYAYFAVGSLHENGGLGEPDARAAHKHYLLGACAGDARATYELSRCYAYGIGVSQDQDLAETLMDISLSRAFVGMWD